MTELIANKAMILAAGLGRRLQPITINTPKPLVMVAGKPIIDYAIDHFVKAGLERLVVNVHYLAEQVIEYLDDRDDIEIIVSDETNQILDTGGGIKKALPFLGNKPFFACNSDIIWHDKYEEALEGLLSGWKDNNMDALLLLKPTDSAFGYNGKGDFFIEPNGMVTRKKAGESAPFVFAGLQLIKPYIFEEYPEEPFSLNKVFDKLLSSERLFGFVYSGNWLHIGDIDGLEIAENYFGGHSNSK